MPVVFAAGKVTELFCMAGAFDKYFRAGMVEEYVVCWFCIVEPEVKTCVIVRPIYKKKVSLSLVSDM